MIRSSIPLAALLAAILAVGLYPAPADAQYGCQGPKYRGNNPPQAYTTQIPTNENPTIFSSSGFNPTQLVRHPALRTTSSKLSVFNVTQCNTRTANDFRFTFGPRGPLHAASHQSGPRGCEEIPRRRV